MPEERSSVGTDKKTNEQLQIISNYFSKGNKSELLRIFATALINNKSTLDYCEVALQKLDLTALIEAGLVKLTAEADRSIANKRLAAQNEAARKAAAEQITLNRAIKLLRDNYTNIFDLQAAISDTYPELAEQSLALIEPSKNITQKFAYASRMLNTYVTNRGEYE